MRKASAKSIVVIAVAIVLMPLLFAGCGSGGENGLLDAGISKLQNGQFDAAVKLLEKAARKHPNNPTAHCNLGIAYWELGEVTRAVASVRKAADIATDDARPLEILGQFYTTMKRWDDARWILREAEQRDAHSPRILTAAALVEFRAGEPAKALEFLERALAENPDYSPAIYNMAVLHRYQDGGDAVATAYFKKYLRTVDEEDPHADTARKFLAPEKPDETEDPIPPPPPPSPADPLVKAARAAITANKFETALINLKEAIKTDPACADALWELAKLYDSRLSNTERATELYGQFMDKFDSDQRSGTARKRLEALILETSRPSLFDTAGTSEADKDKAKAALKQGLEEHTNSNWDEAEKHYRQALAHDAGLVSAAYNMGQVFKAQRDFAAARDAYKYVLDKEPGMSSAGYQLALVLREQKLYDKSLEQAKKVLAAAPDYARAHHLLGLLYRANNKMAPAMEHLERFVQLAPNDPLAKRTRAWLDSQ
ncbi:MAG: tetratricopeptide repeat protein [Kiritimatiellia bacterium]|jgi:tetratricopeptide (TPR) repeat protein|nr:tetratricopeptide repeat protein [Kiritimatiellia bacterium]